MNLPTKWAKSPKYKNRKKQRQNLTFCDFFLGQERRFNSLHRRVCLVAKRKKKCLIDACAHYNVSIYDRQLCFNIGHVMLKYKVYVELLLNICRDRFKYRVYIQTYFSIYSNVKVLLEYMHSNNVEM